MGRERDNSIEKLCTGDDWSGSKGVSGLGAVHSKIELKGRPH